MPESRAMSNEFKLETKSLARQISDNIRSAIVSGELQANDRLPTEQELSARYGVSRPTIREALKRLAAQNLVSSRRGPTGGTFVRQVDSTDMADGLSTQLMLMLGMQAINLEQVIEARSGLERLCIGLAVDNVTAEQLATLKDEIKEQTSADTSDEAFCASDVRFHKTIAAATGNPILHTTMTALLDAVQPATNLIIYRLRDRREVTRQHKHMLKALKAGDSQAALDAMDEQMSSLQTLYRRAQH